MLNSISVVGVAFEPIDDDTLERVIRQQLLRGQEYVGLGRLLALFQPVADCHSAQRVAACVGKSACGDRHGRIGRWARTGELGQVTEYLS